MNPPDVLKTYIALLRGINVGGKNLLPMRELVSILEDLGCQNVKTYIQSGNAVFKTTAKDRVDLCSAIAARIKNRRGFEPLVMLLDQQDFENAIAANPFPEAQTDPKTLHFGFLACAPVSPDITVLNGLKKESERFQLHDRVFYLHAPEGVARSKLAARTERLLGVSMTARNWRTVCKIRDMIKELG